MRLTLHPGTFAVCRLHDAAPDPVADPEALLWSLTRAGTERSLICPEGRAPAHATIAGGWRLLEVQGPMDLGLTGVLASIASPLAARGVPIFATATYDTDWILVPDAQLEHALDALRQAAHDVVDA